MGSIPEITSTLKSEKHLIPIMRCGNYAVCCMHIALKLMGDMVSKRMKVDDEWLSKELALNSLLIASTEDFYDCIPGDIGFCAPPTLEAGHNYIVKLKTMAVKTIGEFSAVQCNMAIHLKNYCCRIARTMMHKPSAKATANGRFLTQVYSKILENLRDGVELRQVYEAAQSFAEEENNSLSNHLGKEFGYVLGPNFQEGSIAINSRSKAIAKKDMIFAITINLIGLEEEWMDYNLKFTDTVMVRQNKLPRVLTKVYKKEFLVRFM